MAPQIIDLKIQKTKAETNLSAIKLFYSLCGYTGQVNPDDDMVIAFNGPDIVGVMRLVYEQGVFILRGMNIREDLQRRGIGSRMLEEFNRLIDAKEVAVTYCLCGAHLESYYGQIRFEKVENFESVPAFLVERMRGYQANYGRQLILRRTCTAQ